MDDLTEFGTDLRKLLSTAPIARGFRVELEARLFQIVRRAFDAGLKTGTNSVARVTSAGESAILSIAEIQQTVALMFGLSEFEMTSVRRSHARPRQIAMYLAKEMTPHSLATIARRFGGRDHTTVGHAIRVIGEAEKTDPEIARQVSMARSQLAERRAA